MGCNHDGWIYFEICQGFYGLPQAGILANNLLCSHLVAKGFYKAASTPGVWRYKWRPIQFCLIINHFGIKYVGVEHFNYLLKVLKKFHSVQFNMAGDNFASINIEWDYTVRCCCMSIRGYLSTLLLKFKHPQPTKPRLSPFKCLPIAYGAKAQLTPKANTSELLNDNCKHHIQKFVGALLYYARVVDNKLLVAISTISTRQSNTTVATEQAGNLFLNYVATYPNDGIAY